jgi:hypothetical protein
MELIFIDQFSILFSELGNPVEIYNVVSFCWHH